MRRVASVFVGALLCLGTAACGGGSSGAAVVTARLSGNIVVAGTPATLTVEAPGYVGVVGFSTNDPKAVIPDDYTFVAGDVGTRVFDAAFEFRTAGTHELRVVANGRAPVVIAVEVIAGPHARFTVDINEQQPGIESAPFGVRAAVIATDQFGNPLDSFDASTDPVTVTSEPAGGTIEGLGSAGNNVMDRTADFANGAADLTGRLVFTLAGTETLHRFLVRSASGKTGSSGFVRILDSGPVVSRFARFEDVNQNRNADAGDRVIVVFDRPVTLLGLDGTAFTVFGSGGLGAGAAVAAGPGDDELTVTLGNGALLQARQVFGVAGASGIDLAAGKHFGLRDVFGLRAESSNPVDVAPGFIQSPNSIGLSNTRGLAAGDLDGDGDVDLVCANLGDAACLHFNDGAGRFPVAAQQRLPTETSAYGAAVGDVDRDGDLDILFANTSGNTVWLNDGNGTFVDSGARLGSQRTFSVILADLDADGDLDLVTGNEGPNRVWVNDGVGRFTDTGAALGTGLTVALTCHDVDRDGDEDVISGDRGLTVWANDGKAEFSLRQQGTATGSTSVALADVDADGDLDAVTGSDGGVRTWLGRTDGTFTAQPIVPGSAGSRYVCITDFDKSARPDLVTTKGIWVNDGEGGFRVMGLNLAESDATGLLVEDLDGDGDDDLVFAHGAGVPNRTYSGSLSAAYGVLAFDDDIEEFERKSRSTGIALGDMDNDGDIDIVAVAGNSTVLYGFGLSEGTPSRVWLNDGEGTFTNSVEDGRGSGDIAFPGNYEAVALGDVDRDGDLDVVAGNGGGAQVWLNDGDAAFSTGPKVAGAAIALALIDVDRDGWLDLLVGTPSSGFVVRNDRKGGFSGSKETFATVETRRFAVGDYDRDGDLDVATAHGNGANRLFFTSASGTLVNSQQLLGQGRTFDIWAADVDRDGDLDLVTGNNQQANRVWLNDGAGRFSDSGQAIGNNCTYAIALVDWDGDGDLDLIEGNSTRPDYIYYNDGKGVFTDSGIRQLAGTTFDMAVADLNGDCSCDVVQANWGWGTGPQNDRIYFSR